MKDALYLECYSGISGDMIVALLLDLGADEKVLRDVLASLPLQGYTIQISRVKKSGIDANDFDVRLEEKNHDHDMEYLYGHYHETVGSCEPHMHNHEHNHDHKHDHDYEHNHDHKHDHDHEHNHDHKHDHDYEHNYDHKHDHDYEHEHDHKHDHDYEHNHDHKHDHDYEHNHDHKHDHDYEHEHHHTHAHDHSHQHRGMKEITDIINAGVMTESAKKLALKIFYILAVAESQAHNGPYEEVHFHEVGAVDSIVDIVSAAVCLDNLGIEEVIVPSLYEGVGTVRCMHGILPVPVPAVANIIQSYGIPLQIQNMEGEYITPTGAAVVAAITTKQVLPKHFQIHKIGIGAGKRDYEGPGFVRGMLIEANDYDK